MAEIPDVLLVHKVLIQRPTGTLSSGSVVYTPAQELRCFLEYRVQIIRNPVGQELASNVQVFTHSDESVPLASLIDLGDGNPPRRVIIAVPHTDGGLGAWQHLEVFCE